MESGDSFVSDGVGVKAFVLGEGRSGGILGVVMTLTAFHLGTCPCFRPFSHLTTRYILETHPSTQKENHPRHPHIHIRKTPSLFSGNSNPHQASPTPTVTSSPFPAPPSPPISHRNSPRRDPGRQRMIPNASRSGSGSLLPWCSISLVGQ